LGHHPQLHALVTVIVIVLIAIASPVRVDIPSQQFNELQSRRSDLFQILINNPDNLGAAFEYALLSVEVGDLEGVIGTLEHMLIYAPDPATRTVGIGGSLLPHCRV